MPERNPVDGPAVPNPTHASAESSAVIPPASASGSAPSTPATSAPPSPTAAPGSETAVTAPATTSQSQTPGEVDLRWVWLEVRKRVFIKLPFSRQVAEVMEAAVPIALENNTFICGLPTVKFPLSGFS
jgi:hypothetical protein